MARRKHAFLFAVLAAGSLLVALGLFLAWYFNPTPGSLALKPVGFADVPGWSSTDPRSALSAFQRSCAVFAKKADTAEVGSYGGTVAEWRGARGWAGPSWYANRDCPPMVAPLCQNCVRFLVTVW